MISHYMSTLLARKERSLVQRNFEPQILTDDNLHQEFANNGYIVIKNVLPPRVIDRLYQLYQNIEQKDTFEHTEYYFNTISFQDQSIRSKVVSSTLESMQPYLDKFIDSSTSKMPLGGNFCINPGNASRGCPPHQDPTFIDEQSTYSIMLWFPLLDVNEQNGCLHFIPKSHLWGNFHRSMSIRWAFDDYLNELWEYAVPLPLNVGDVVAFDSSIIHCSRANTTVQTRLAINIPVFPKHAQMRNYFPKKGLLNYNHAELYHIDENYFIKESQYERPSSKYKMKRIVKLDNYYSRKHLKNLLGHKSN